MTNDTNAQLPTTDSRPPITSAPVYEKLRVIFPVNAAAYN